MKNLENRFLYKIESFEEDEKIKIIKFFALKNYQTFVETTFIDYEILVNKNSFEKLNFEKKGFEIVEKFENLENDKVLKLKILNLEIKNFLIHKFKENNVKMYELDLPYENRYLIDNKIEIFEGDFSKIRFKYLCLDIETIGDDFSNQKIVLISTFSPINFNFVYVNLQYLDEDKKNQIRNMKNKKADFQIKYFENEKQMLENFQKDILEKSFQIFTGWNVVDFDFNVIKIRFDYYKIPFVFSNYDGETKIRIIKDFFKDSTLLIPGILVMDSIMLLKKNFINFPDFKLSTVAKIVLEDDKIDLEDDDKDNEEESGDFSTNDKINLITKLYLKNPQKLIEYNFKDSKLVSLILEKLDIFDLMKNRSIISKTPLLKVKSPIASLDIMYLSLLHNNFKKVANSNFNFLTSGAIMGAYVITPKKGFYDDIFVFDFKSLYPSIIMTYNLDPLTMNNEGEIITPNNIRFKNSKSILPQILLDLSSKRDMAKKEKDKIKSNAIKTTMNSFYGAIASPKSRFYSKEIGEAITSFGRQTIKDTKKFIEEDLKIGKIIYGDTDSCFIKFNKKFVNNEDKMNYSKEIQEKINDFFNKKISKINRKNFLKIEAEKIYEKFFIASKKRYVGLNSKTKKLDFVGLEFVRGDWTELAKNFQLKIVNLIFQNSSKDKIKTFVYDFIDKLKKKEFDKDLIYFKKLTKDLVDYTKTTPPHVKAAREVKNFDGRNVKYLMTLGGPKHISKIDEKTKIDYNHYIEKQLIGVSDDLFESIGIDIEDLVYKKTQNSLNKFF